MGLGAQLESAVGLNRRIGRRQFCLRIFVHGAKNAGLFAVRILAAKRPELRQKLHAYHAEMAEKIKKETLP